MIPVNTPSIGEKEKLYLNECVDSGWLSSDGPFVEKFEQAMATICGRKYAVSVCNGTAALELAFQSLQLPAGSEVILPSFTIISCVYAVLRAGLVPVFVDADAETWNMDLSQLEKKITPKTKAILSVHTYGLPVEMDKLQSIAQKHGLKIIEDAAEQIGQSFRGKPCGSFGELSTLSFYANKHITCGEGGMIVTDELVLAERLRSLRNLCFMPERRFVHNELSGNFRISNLQAAVGLAQSERLAMTVERKRAIGQRYHEGLRDLACLQLPLQRTDYAENIYWVFGVVLKHKMSAIECMEKLRQRGIGTRPFFYPMHLQPVFKGMDYSQGEPLPVSEWLGEKGFYLPSGTALSDAEVEQVVEQLRAILLA